jgi:two-component system KDP operon response regulator KdpE
LFKNRVLVIDDDRILTDMLKLSLESEAFDVSVANTGEEGLRNARLQNPDVIILDLMMPGTDGWKTGQAIREFSKVPILVLSALDKPGIVTRALDEGADDFLMKPVSIELLVAHLNKLTRRARAEIEAAKGKKGQGAGLGAGHKNPPTQPLPVH